MAFISEFCFLLSSVCTLNEFVLYDNVDFDTGSLYGVILSYRSIRRGVSTEIVTVTGRMRVLCVVAKYARDDRAQCVGLTARTLIALC